MSFAPDTALVHAVAPSPNHGDRRDGARPDMLILHYTGMVSGQEALARLTQPESQVSAHYLVEEDGRILQLVPEALRAWHAGESYWRGLCDINSRSIGIELVNPGHRHGLRPFPARQIDSLIQLCRDCVSRWAIAAESVLAHSDIAPARKEDPGELFPWDQLSRHGIGITVEAPPVSGGRYLALGDRGQPVAAYQAMLSSLGFDVPQTAIFDETTRLATIALQRHHRQSLVDGVADASTVGVLHRLLLARMPELDGGAAPA